MEELMAEILEELKIELEVTEESDIAILTVKLKNAMREIKTAFNFKSYHTDDFILENMTEHIGNIKNLTIYDYMKIGAEGEGTHSEKNIRRVYDDRAKCFSGIVRFCD